MAPSENGEDEPPSPIRHSSIPTVIVSEPPSPEGMADEKDANGGVNSPKFDVDGDSDNDNDSVDQSQVMDQALDYSTLSLNFQNEQGLSFLPKPPDGGYGWVIVAVAFICNFIIDGICNSFSEFKKPFSQHFETSETMTSLIGSTIIAMYLLCGPIVGGLVNKYGPRKVVVAGALLAGFSFIVSSFISNIWLFLIVYGCFGGVGFGMIYLPAIVVVGYYFESKRAVATGISVAGSGVGTIVMPLLSEVLIRNFGFSRAMWFNAGLVFVCGIVGLLFKPLEDMASPIDEKAKEELELELLKQRLNQAEDGDEEEEEETEPPKKSSSHATRTSEWIDKSTKVLAEDAGIDDDGMIRLRNALSECENGEVEDGKSNGTGPNTRTTSPTPAKEPLTPIKEGRDSSFKQRSSTHQTAGAPSNAPRSRKLTLTSLGSDMYSNLDLNPQGSRGNLNGVLSRISARSIAQSMTRLSSKGAASSLSIAMTGVDPHEIHRPMNRKDIFYGGSIRNLKEFQDEGKNFAAYRESVISIPTSVISRAASRMSVTGDLTDVGTRIGGSRMSRLTGGIAPEDELELEYIDDSRFKWVPLSIRNAFNEMIDVQLLKDPIMILLCASNLLGMMGFYIPFMYLKSLGVSNGISESQAGLLVPIIGVTNTIGRIFFGWMADRGFVSALTINNFALVACGLLSIICPFLPGFMGLAVYSAVFGFIISAYICLTSIVLTDLLGLEKLTNSFGLLVVSRGVASLVGSPFAGMVYDVTNSFAASFIFAGSIIAISGVISFGIPFADRFRRSKGDNEGDIEKDEDAVSGKLSVLTERSEENLTEYQRTIQSLRQQHTLLREYEEEKKRIAANKDSHEIIGEDDNELEEADQHTALLHENKENGPKIGEPQPAEKVET